MRLVSYPASGASQTGIKRGYPTSTRIYLYLIFLTHPQTCRNLRYCIHGGAKSPYPNFYSHDVQSRSIENNNKLQDPWKTLVKLSVKAWTPDLGEES